MIKLIIPLILCVTSAFGQLRIIGFDTIASTVNVSDTPVWEISGLSHDNSDDEPFFWGVSDTILKDFPKRIFSFQLDLSGDIPSLTEPEGLGGVVINDPDPYLLKYSDTESVVYLEDDENAITYYIISTEGYREYDSFTNFFVYNSAGAYIGNLSYDTTIFQEQGNHTHPTSGFGEGDGVEAMSASTGYNQVIFIGSNTLVQDDCGDDGCVRISVNTMNYDANVPTWTEEYQFRYDKEFPYTTVADATIVSDDDLSIVVVLEKTEFVTNDVVSFVIKAYEINLETVGGDQDIKDCQALTSGGCTNYDQVIEKTLIGDLSEMDEAIENIQEIDFDAIARGTGVGCNENEYFLMAASDNDEVSDTYFAYLCFQHESLTTSTPTTTATPSDASNKSFIFSILMIIAIFTFVY